MPLKKGKPTREKVRANIREMIKAGRPRDQAVAAAYATARRWYKKHDKTVPDWLKERSD